MTNRIADISLHKAALIAGFGYLVIFLFGFGNFLLEDLIVRGDAAEQPVISWLPSRNFASALLAG